MESIFTIDHFDFPYAYKFPGMASDERILYVTREHKVMYLVRQTVLVGVALVVLLTSWWLGQLLSRTVNPGLGGGFGLFGILAAVAFLCIGWWWQTVLWRRSIALVTNKRLVKFVYTTPWNRHNLALPLDMVVDTGAYSKGFLQAWLGLGTFTARSSASSSGVATDDPQRVNKKYFYIENVGQAEDLHHYLSKVLFIFRQDWTRLANFRPFLPELKGEARKEYMHDYPEYWS